MTDLAFILGLLGVVFAPLGWLMETLCKRTPENVPPGSYMDYWFRGGRFSGRWARRLGLAGIAVALVLFALSALVSP